MTPAVATKPKQKKGRPTLTTDVIELQKMYRKEQKLLANFEHS